MANDHDDDDFDESGLVAPPSMPTQAVPVADEAVLHFGEETGPLPHWTEPPTGQVPKRPGPALGEGDDDLAWSGFGASAPAWRENDDDDLTGPVTSPPPRGRVVIDHGGDVSGAGPSVDLDPSSPVSTIRGARRSADGTSTRIRPDRLGSRPAPPRARPAAAPGRSSGRNMPVAIGVGVGLAALLAVIAKAAGAKGIVGLVAVVLGLAAVEFFDSVRKAGYAPAQLLGIVACAALPLAAYWRGESGLPFVLALAVAATLMTFIFSGTIESNPLPNTSVTVFGITYIGVLGAFAALILQFPNGIGTIWACVLGAVAYDVGGLLFGSSIGRSPLVQWISPHKTWEGLLLGMLASFLAVMACNIFGLAPWNAKLIQCVQLAVVVSIAAPLGDLAESMLKRSLGTKDFGTMLPGHGGVLDRFDTFLFVLPAAYYLSRVLNVY